MNAAQIHASLLVWQQRRMLRAAMLKTVTKKRDHAGMTKWAKAVHDADVKVAYWQKLAGKAPAPAPTGHIGKPIVPPAPKPTPAKPTPAPAKPVKPKPAPKPSKPTEAQYRKALVAEMDWALAHEPQIGYSMTNRMHLTQWREHKLPIDEDCSSSTTCIAYKVGLPDPNNLGYNGTGYTGTLGEHARAAGKIIPKSKLQPGDIVLWGTGTFHHVTYVYSVKGGEIELFSHGQARGPIKISWADEQQFQGSQYTCARMV